MPLFPACGSGGAVAMWNYGAFQVQYPVFAAAPPEPTLEAYFDMASIWLRNDGTGPVRKVTVQTWLMNMLVAHLTQLFNGPDGTGDGAGIVGRISSATEGSVTVATEMEASLSSAWFNQTPYGATFWQATAAWRTFPRYMPGQTRFGNGIGTFGPTGRNFR